MYDDKQTQDMRQRTQAQELISGLLDRGRTEGWLVDKSEVSAKATTRTPTRLSALQVSPMKMNITCTVQGHFDIFLKIKLNEKLQWFSLKSPLCVPSA